MAGGINLYQFSENNPALFRILWLCAAEQGDQQEATHPLATMRTH